MLINRGDIGNGIYSIFGRGFTKYSHIRCICTVLANLEYKKQFMLKTKDGRKTTGKRTKWPTVRPIQGLGFSSC